MLLLPAINYKGNKENPGQGVIAGTNNTGYTLLPVLFTLFTLVNSLLLLLDVVNTADKHKVANISAKFELVSMGYSGPLV
jgi:hypothetical protein